MGGLTSENCVQNLTVIEIAFTSSELKFSTIDTATSNEFSEKRSRNSRTVDFSLCRQAKGIIKGALFREMYSILLTLLFVYLRFINYVVCTYETTKKPRVITWPRKRLLAFEEYAVTWS